MLAAGMFMLVFRTLFEIVIGICGVILYTLSSIIDVIFR